MVAPNESFAPANPIRSPKNRVGNFFGESGDSRRANRLPGRHPRRENGHDYGTTASGMFYYGFRYYLPETGRWASRDPIGERGGLNLYAFVGNNGVNAWDIKGKKPDTLTPADEEPRVPGTGGGNAGKTGNALGDAIAGAGEALSSHLGKQRLKSALKSCTDVLKKGKCCKGCCMVQVIEALNSMSSWVVMEARGSFACDTPCKALKSRDKLTRRLKGFERLKFFYIPMEVQK